jgi:hypothetical protein
MKTVLEAFFLFLLFITLSQARCIVAVLVYPECLAPSDNIYKYFDILNISNLLYF